MAGECTRIPRGDRIKQAEMYFPKGEHTLGAETIQVGFRVPGKSNPLGLISRPLVSRGCMTPYRKHILQR